MVLGAGAGRATGRAGLEPGQHVAGQAEEERRDPVLEMVRARARLMTREEARQVACRRDPVDDRDRDEQGPEQDRGDDQLSVLGHVDSEPLVWWERVK